MKTELIVVRQPGSHRSRGYAERALGFKPQSYYGWHVNGQYWFLTMEDFVKIRQYGATRSRIKPAQIQRCWPSDDPRFQPNQPYATP